ncbi:MAG: hypothetical protein II670_08930 [Alphaproteobacteria bacterium]|nr:hypothetical protein [Alphaproteobacteria bacterium]
MSTFTFILLVGLITAFYLVVRNEQVYELQMLVSRGCHGYLLSYIKQNEDDFDLEQYENLRARVYEINDRYSYDRMLFSFRSLRLDCWYTQDEVDIIEEGINNEEAQDILDRF